MQKLDRKELQALKLASKENRDPKALDRQRRTKGVVVVPIRKPSHGAGAVFAARLTDEERLAEAVGLSSAIDLKVCFSGLVNLTQTRPATLIGTGKVDEIGAIVKAEGAEVVVVDHVLTPVQQRNLETAWNAKVLDRTGLILEIFADRAQSKEGRLQVELARLTYQKSRLVRSWTHLERQRGGFGFLGGPGETQIEADRRAIGERIDAIKSDLSVIERTRRLHRKRRKITKQTIVSLVGYTNAGKSTLFNALAGSDVFAKDMLFATLDPTLRRVRFPDGAQFILSDTVGFISDLPTQLIAAFRATLEEIVEADLILHVRDIVSPSTSAQAAEVQAVLAQIGIDKEAYDSRVIEVWNKADLLADDDRERLERLAQKHAPAALVLSAQTGKGVPELTSLIQERIGETKSLRKVVIDQGNGALINWLYENTEILDRQDYHDGSLHFAVRIAAERERDLDKRVKRPAC